MSRDNSIKMVILGSRLATFKKKYKLGHIKMHIIVTTCKPDKLFWKLTPVVDFNNILRAKIPKDTDDLTVGLLGSERVSTVNVLAKSTPGVGKEWVQRKLFLLRFKFEKSKERPYLPSHESGGKLFYWPFGTL